MKKFLIKKALLTDAAILTKLAKNTFEETFAKDNTPEDMNLYMESTFSFEKQFNEINDPKRWIEIAWANGEAIGFFHLLKGKADPSVTGSEPIELLRLYVKAQWHGKGVAASLMDRCLEIAGSEGFRTLWLGVWENNYKAIAFYKKYGFVPVGKHIFRLGNDEQLDLIMERSV